MIPHLTLFKRLFAWLLFRIEARHHWGAGFDSNDIEGAKWLLLNHDAANMSYCYSLMRDYLYVKMAKEAK